MKILYISKDFLKKSDGAQIYDFKICEALKKNGYEVKNYFIKYKKTITIPFWKKKIDTYQINELLSLKKDFSITIISHEILSDLVDKIKPDLFIFHNVFSIFNSPNIILNFYYNLFSKYQEKKVILNSKNILVLSVREKKYLSSLYKSINIICEPPGLKSIEVPVIINFNTLKLTGSGDWLPKKLSKLKESELNILKSKFKITYDEIKETNTSLIEENFKAGFKLKLLEMLFNGDCIYSRVDLTEEIKHLGLKTDMFYFIKNISEIDNKNKDLSSLSISVKYNQNLLLEFYTWEKITRRIVENIIK